MEAKLDALIERIKKEAVVDAQARAGKIIEEAKSEAQRIKDGARKESEAIIDGARAEADKLRAQAKYSLQQGCRDFVLAVKGRIQDLFLSILNKKTAGTLKPEFLKELILNIVSQWKSKQPVEFYVSKDDREKLFDLLVLELKEEMKKDIEIIIDSKVKRGFKVGIKGNDFYYDLTEGAIAEMLSGYVSPKIAGLLNVKEKDGNE